MAHLELTPKEVIRLVQGLNAVPDGMCVANDRDELAFWINDEHTQSLGEKIKALGDDPEVQEALGKN